MSQGSLSNQRPRSIVNPHVTGPSPSGEQDIRSPLRGAEMTKNYPSYNATTTMKTKRIEQLTYILPVLKALVYLAFKVSLIALSEKVFRASLDATLEAEQSAELNAVLDPIREDKVTNAFLLGSLTFYETFAVTVGLVILSALLYPGYSAISEHYLNRKEVKRLQLIFYDKFILEVNSFNVAEASELAHTKIAAVEYYWRQTKYGKVDNMASIIFGLILFMVLAWDLGLVTLLVAIIVFIVSTAIWKVLSTPYAQQREQKAEEASARLLDLVICKDLVVTHAKEVEEREALREAIDSDSDEIRHLVRAAFCSGFVEVLTFTMTMPILFMFVHEVDLTIERVFQLLLVVVLLDELLRSYLANSKHAPIIEEYERAKRVISMALDIDEDDLFPPAFDFSTKTSKIISVDTESDVSTVDLEAQVSAKEAIPNHVRAERSTQRRLSDVVRNALNVSKEEASTGGMPSILFEDVSFGYPTKSGEVFTVIENLTLSFQLGTHYAILGETGAGKSTIFRGLAGLMRPTAGHIKVAGERIDMTHRSWRSQMGVVSQDSVLLNRSLRDNLTYGINKECTDVDIFEALEAVNMKDRVLAMPDVLDTVIRENGNELSGGQRQRIQIARLLLRDCDIVLLDECTSALDKETTEEILEILKKFLVGRTLIMITHDLETLVLAEKTLKVKVGGHIEVIDAAKRYSRLSITMASP